MGLSLGYSELDGVTIMNSPAAVAAFAAGQWSVDTDMGANVGGAVGKPAGGHVGVTSANLSDPKVGPPLCVWSCLEAGRDRMPSCRRTRSPHTRLPSPPLTPCCAPAPPTRFRQLTYDSFTYTVAKGAMIDFSWVGTCVPRGAAGCCCGAAAGLTRMPPAPLLSLPLPLASHPPPASGVHYTPDAETNAALYGAEGATPEAVLEGGAAPPEGMAPLYAALTKELGA